MTENDEIRQRSESVNTKQTIEDLRLLDPRANLLDPILPLRFNSVKYPTPYTSRTHLEEYERHLRQRRKEEVARALEEVRIRTERETFLRQSEERGVNINGTFRDFLESAQAYILRSINSDECEEHPEEPKNKRFKAQE